MILKFLILGLLKKILNMIFKMNQMPQKFKKRSGKFCRTQAKIFYVSCIWQY